MDVDYFGRKSAAFGKCFVLNQAVQMLPPFCCRGALAGPFGGESVVEKLARCGIPVFVDGLPNRVDIRTGRKPVGIPAALREFVGIGIFDALVVRGALKRVGAVVENLKNNDG